MEKTSAINKTAWEYRAYEFWNQRDGSPADKAKAIRNDPKASLKKHQHLFKEVTGKKNCQSLRIERAQSGSAGVTRC
ncbi:hypothetical protein [Exiguobacterium sp. s80]|uniref:hypothetical protein n=1 Tax=Exiguobacterium sp. s80 TaxID=2751209 RepID=UPI001BE76C65|nr:hypothetical protein [Exiguobacterium sp. s80]